MIKYLLIILFLSVTSFCLSATRFTDNGDGTITANDTGLVWQKCTAGHTGADCSSGSADFYRWETAILYCEGLSLGNRTDWRLPSINEQRSIIDFEKFHPAIDSNYFPGTLTGTYDGTRYFYWTSTTSHEYSLDAWRVWFYYGTAHVAEKTESLHVRCVAGP